MAITRLSLRPGGPFDFAGTAYSHGWVVLAPHRWDAESATLERIHRLSSSRVVRLELAGVGPGDEEAKHGEAEPGDADVGVLVEHRGRLGEAARTEIEAAVTRMLRLDEDLSGFYELCDRRGEPWTRVTSGLGRLLRSPGFFEDVVKTICTTNIQWGGTRRMVEGLVEVFGEPWPADPTRRAFPTAEAIAAVSGAAFAGRTALGYRAPYVHELARRVAGGELDLEALASSDLPTPELRRELLSIKGVGSYASATLLMLLGRYDELAVDSVFRDFVAGRYFGGEPPSEEEARAVYEGWGEWKYLAYWFDVWEGTGEEV